MHHVIGALLIGGVAGGVTGGRARLRPMVRDLVKGGIVAKRRIQAVSNAAIAETQKLVDEARADLDRAEAEPKS
jgi:molybdenum-dependent DNA-binding transcriptional regulator ModE